MRVYSSAIQTERLIRHVLSSHCVINSHGHVNWSMKLWKSSGTENDEECCVCFRVIFLFIFWEFVYSLWFSYQRDSLVDQLTFIKLKRFIRWIHFGITRTGFIALIRFLSVYEWRPVAGATLPASLNAGSTTLIVKVFLVVAVASRLVDVVGRWVSVELVWAAVCVKISENLWIFLSCRWGLRVRFGSVDFHIAVCRCLVCFCFPGMVENRKTAEKNKRNYENVWVENRFGALMVNLSFLGWRNKVQ